MPVRVKICGITNEADALMAAELGADAIGLNRFPGSPRCVPEERAVAIVRSLPPHVEAVALFVNESWEHILAAATRLGVFRVQVHGDRLEPCPYPQLRWMPAFPVRDRDSLTAIETFLADCPGECRPAALLVDAHVAGKYGGTGQTAPWEVLAGFRPGVPLVLAGGLTRENVAAAVRIVQPAMVDVASGVESAPGAKDREKLRRFIAAAHSIALD